MTSRERRAARRRKAAHRIDYVKAVAPLRERMKRTLGAQAMIKALAAEQTNEGEEE